MNYAKTHAQVTDPSRSPLARYQRVVVGSTSTWYTLKYEILTTLLGGLGGSLGLALRGKFLPRLFRHVGRGVVIGRNVTILHPKKISLGDAVVIADGAVLDARGDDNDGIVIRDNVVIGRDVALVCKNGDIHIDHDAQLSPHTLISAVHGNTISIGAHALIGPFSYIGGGGYQTGRTDLPIALQGNDPRGGVQIGDHAWLGVRSVVLDGHDVGHDAIVGAGSIVTSDIPPFGVAVGAPARVIRLRTETSEAPDHGPRRESDDIATGVEF